MTAIVVPAIGKVHARQVFCLDFFCRTRPGIGVLSERAADHSWPGAQGDLLVSSDVLLAF